MKQNTSAPPARPRHENRSSRPARAQGVFGALIPELQRAVTAEGYTTPTPIQEQCIPHLIEGRDLIGTAQTGTGKTAAFTLPLLQQLAGSRRRPRPGYPRALILAPTRELAGQIGDSIHTYGRYLRLRHTVIYGGVSQFHQVRALNRGVDIVVATPGRLLDLVRQGHLRLDGVEVFILDEVDRMLDMGFMPDIQQVVSDLPTDRQTLFFSATIAREMVKLAHTLVRDPVSVAITPEQPTVERIEQKVLFVGKRNKDALLLDLLADPDIEKAIVFTQMKHAANRLVEKLDKAGIPGTAIHGNKSQAARSKALDAFRRGRCRVLVATDVAARGLDVDDISHVINYDLPIEAETYVHRIGRTARAGADGDAISFCCAEDRSYLRDIERLLGGPVPPQMDHAFHCDEAFRSTMPPPKRFGGRNGGGGNRNGGNQRGGRPRAQADRRGGRRGPAKGGNRRPRWASA